jgi:sodium-dependent dicarboxylate transporter 2/3/5
MVEPMRQAHETAETLETYSPAEEQFKPPTQEPRTHRRTALCLLVLFAAASAARDGHRLSAVMLLMIVLWMTEALPLAVTALLGPMLAVILGVAPAGTVFTPFADPKYHFSLHRQLHPRGGDVRFTGSTAGWRSPRSRRHG